jgi:pimeloyl-ACP methyl ester carboxylesterase
LINAQEWVDSGTRVPFDYQQKKIVSTDDKPDTSGSVHVFQRLVKAENTNNESTFLTMMPGFPDGSYGWSRVENILSRTTDLHRLYVEYVGQGDSDKPKKYDYGINERADLVEALWKHNGIRNTCLVTFDYSSLVAMELLRRQKEKTSDKVTISKVLFINGGYFSDAHSHPIMTTPLLKTTFGKAGTFFVQKSLFVFNIMMKGLWSKEYNVSKEELGQFFNVITRRNGAIFLHNAAGFVDEHKRNAQRLDLVDIVSNMHDEISFHIVGSEKDQFEPNQVVKARERLEKYNVDIRMVPGGHMITSEHPDILANLVKEVCEEK